MVNILYAVLCLLYINVHFYVYFVDFMYDKDDNIEIMSTKSHTNSSRPESRNLEDRFVIIILIIPFIYYFNYWFLIDLTMSLMHSTKSSTTMIIMMMI